MSMFGGSFSGEYEALSQLIRDPEEAVVPACGISKPTATPAAIGPKELLNVTIAAPKGKKDSKAIWDEDELEDQIGKDDLDDGRESPEYEFLYKQAVGTEDTFLGMSGKDPSTTCCEELVVKIPLPSVSSMSELELTVKPTYLKLSSTKYKLSLYLPHKVNDEKGHAKWDSSKKILTVTLPIVRSDDF